MLVVQSEAMPQSKQKRDPQQSEAPKKGVVLGADAFVASLGPN